MTNEIKFDDIKFRREAEEFREVRARLQTAVRRVEPPRDLEARIRTSLAQEPHARSWNRKLMLVAAGMAVMTGVWLTWQVAGVRAVTIAQQSYVLKVSEKTATIMRVGLEQHIHCATYRPPGKPADSAQNMTYWLAEYKDLLPLVRARVAAGFQLLTAHKCKFRGREFVHFQFQEGSKLLSLLIVHKRQGESFAVEGLAPALVESGLPVYSAGVQSFQMSGFETRDHLAYVVSNLPGKENIEIASSIAPVVKQALVRIEA